MNAILNSPDLHLAFDVGHSSIGWAVLRMRETPEMLGTGVVTFGADDCLASKRRMYRRQRRHIRATRQRVARLERLLQHLDVMTADELKAKHRAAGGHSAPWLLAARVLAAKDSSALLTWPQLWDVIRWYAHNRGYDGNRRWAAVDAADAREDTDGDSEKEQNAIALMTEYGTRSMAETMVRVLDLDPTGSKQASRIRFKGKNAAFPRAVVEREVLEVLNRHRGQLPKLDDAFISALFTDWRAVAIPDLHLPIRYQGGLLFGQLVPRFDNRIIATCPISGAKVPTRNSPEFLRFRWAMQLANIRVGGADDALRPLSADERHTVDTRMQERGRLTKGEFKAAVRGLPGILRDNLDALLMHPDAEEALVLDPIAALMRSGPLAQVWPTLSPRVQKRARDAWGGGKSLTLSELRDLAIRLGEPVDRFDAAVTRSIDAANTRTRKRDTPVSTEALLREVHSVKRLSGRAAYARPILVRAVEEVMRGGHPKEPGGCLYLDEAAQRARMSRRLEEQTNNHLVRHRLTILGRLLADLVSDPQFANGDRSRVARIAVEVNRDLREMSGKSAKEVEKELTQRLSNHTAVSKKLEAAFADQTFNGAKVEISAGLIRKARVADDLKWVCPYTGVNYEAIDLVSRRVDKDHIIPRSQRPSDSLDSLAITFSEINRWKGDRTAYEFVQQEQGRAVPGLPNLSIRPLAEYTAWVEALDTFKGHDDDRRRKKNRRMLLLLPHFEDKNGKFLPGDLTQTSQLVRLAAQRLMVAFADLPTPPVVTSIPGSVTAVVRRSWSLLGCLAIASPQVLEADGSHKTKTEIRGITHLHHALDACVLAYATLLLPRDGGVWELMIKRNLNATERESLRATGCFDFDAQGQFGLRDLPAAWKAQIAHRLAEKRVVQHVPADMGGLHVEENTRGVVKVEDGRVYLHQRAPRDEHGNVVVKETAEPVGKVVGLFPSDGAGKLKPMKGVRVITDNFGVALLDHASDPNEPFAIIPWHKVWYRLGELAAKNSGVRPRLLRPGMVIRVPRGRYQKAAWMVRGVVLNQRMGHVIELAEPDVINSRQSGKTYCKQNVSLATLVRDGIEILPPTLAGHAFTGADAKL